MRIWIIAGESVEITSLLTEVTWSGDRTQAGRKLEFSYVQDDRDLNIPKVRVDAGYTVVGADDSGSVVFRGNIYAYERDRAKSTAKIVAYDNNYVLNKSKTTRKVEKMYPEDLARSICRELGVKIGDIARTGVAVSFIANSKSGYEIIMMAYTQAKAKTGKAYQCVMRGDELCVIEQGSLSGVILDSAKNMTDSIYKISIENLVNNVLIVDAEGNAVDYVSDSSSQRQYSMYQAIYREQKDKDTRQEANALLNKPERQGVVTAIGDYRAVAGYSLIVRDSNFNGQFWIKSDSHSFRGGQHTMKLTLEYEIQMAEVK